MKENYNPLISQIDEEELKYEYSTRGFTVYYKDNPISSVELLPDAKDCQDNLKMFKEMAEKARQEILDGFMGRGNRCIEYIVKRQKEDIHNG